ncbi:hypothetical protein Cagg_1745 [Chloroflexus aggregans DSM 9485]|uniref:Uncharacterized protein n=1 Tax=Chloroflexus aggregans (strain MD-66 / DSM 9485) TaxID=326427 RepID=B8GAQ7_CHLAD|nr:hypothetical protein Cagg_1745 [Chloroflexus aggregans DSM 9485]
MIVLVTTYAILRTGPPAWRTGYRAPNRIRSFLHTVPSTARLRHPAHRPTRVAYRASSTQPHTFISPRCAGHRSPTPSCAPIHAHAVPGTARLRHPAHRPTRVAYRASSTQPHTFISPRCAGHRSPTPSCAPIRAHAVPGTARLRHPMHRPTRVAYRASSTQPHTFISPRCAGHRSPTPSCAPAHPYAHAHHIIAFCGLSLYEQRSVDRTFVYVFS